MDRLKLLIIEDDPDQRELIREVVEERFGAGTVVGVDSRKAAAAQDLAAFDLILCDYNLPDANGLEVLGEIRSRCATPVSMLEASIVAVVLIGISLASLALLWFAAGVVICPLAAIAGLIYARLLGHLAWSIGQKV